MSFQIIMSCPVVGSCTVLEFAHRVWEDETTSYSYKTHRIVNVKREVEAVGTSESWPPRSVISSECCFLAVLHHSECCFLGVLHPGVLHRWSEHHSKGVDNTGATLRGNNTPKGTGNTRKNNTPKGQHFEGTSEGTTTKGQTNRPNGQHSKVKNTSNPKGHSKGHPKGHTQNGGNTPMGQQSEGTTPRRVQHSGNTSKGQHSEGSPRGTTLQKEHLKDGQHTEGTTLRGDNTPRGQHSEGTTATLRRVQHSEGQHSEGERQHPEGWNTRRVQHSERITLRRMQYSWGTTLRRGGRGQRVQHSEGSNTPRLSHPLQSVVPSEYWRFGPFGVLFPSECCPSTSECCPLITLSNLYVFPLKLAQHVTSAINRLLCQIKNRFTKMKITLNIFRVKFTFHSMVKSSTSHSLRITEIRL
jgi:hypothetical protein